MVYCYFTIVLELYVIFACHSSGVIRVIIITDYILEAEKHLNDKRVYKEVKFNENILTGLVEKSNKIFNRLCSHILISESELRYFTYNFKKAINLGKLYFLPKIHKRLANVPGNYFQLRYSH